MTRRTCNQLGFGSSHSCVNDRDGPSCSAHILHTVRSHHFQSQYLLHISRCCSEPSNCIALVSINEHCPRRWATVCVTHREIYFDYILKALRELGLNISLREAEKCRFWEESPVLRVGLVGNSQRRSEAPPSVPVEYYSREPGFPTLHRSSTKRTPDGVAQPCDASPPDCQGFCFVLGNLLLDRDSAPGPCRYAGKACQGL